jgi:hypothetical protein
MLLSGIVNLISALLFIWWGIGNGMNIIWIGIGILIFIVGCVTIGKSFKKK